MTSLKNLPSTKTVRMVRDTSKPEDQQIIPAAALLKGLTTQSTTEMRKAMWSKDSSGGAPRYLCHDCGQPIYLSNRPSGSDGSQSTPVFAHWPKSGPCEWRTPKASANIGALQYQGMQEGEQHELLKLILARCLEADPLFSAIRIEKQVRSDDGSWRQPDVSAVLDGKVIAFDVQLATLPTSTIVEREAHYRKEGIVHFWVVDPDNLPQLSRQSFQDMYLTTGGRVLAVNASCPQATHEHGELTLIELQLLPKLDPKYGIYNVWDWSWVGSALLALDPQRRRLAGQQCYVDSLHEQAVIGFGKARDMIREAALAGQPIKAIRTAWRDVASVVHGSSADTADVDGVGQVCALLRVVEDYCASTDAKRTENLTLVLERLRALLVSPKAQTWTALIDHVLLRVPKVAAAMPPSYVQKLETLRQASANQSMHYHRKMLAVLHPWLAFYLLASPPKFGPRIRPHSNHAA